MDITGAQRTKLEVFLVEVSYLFFYKRFGKFISILHEGFLFDTV